MAQSWKEWEKASGATKQATTPVKPWKEWEKASGAKETKWQWFTKQISKPVGVASEGLETVGRTAGALAMPLFDKKTSTAQSLRNAGGELLSGGKDIGQILAGKKQTDYLTKIQEGQKEREARGEKVSKTEKVLGGITGFGANVILDPLNKLGIGELTKQGKLAQQVTKAADSGTDILKGSRLAKDMVKSGKTIEQLRLGATKAEQAVKGQRALLSFFDKTIVKGDKFYKGAGAIGDVVKATAPARAIKTIFSRKTGNELLDNLVEQADNASAYRKQQVIDTAVDIEKKLKGATPDDVNKISQIIETPTEEFTFFSKVRNLIKHSESQIDTAIARGEDVPGYYKEGTKILTQQGAKGRIDDISMKLDSFKPGLGDTYRQAVGKGEMTLADLEKAGVKLLDDTGNKTFGVADDLRSLLDKMKVSEKNAGVLRAELENYFPHIKAKEKLGERINHFFNAKKYSATLNASKERTIKTLTSINNPDLPPITGVEEKLRKGFLTKIGDAELQAKGFSPLDSGNIFRDKVGNIYNATKSTIEEVNDAFGKKFFETNPAVAYATRGLASAKAVTAKEFLDEAGKKFFVNAESAPANFVESTNPLFKGLKADPDVVKHIDSYIKGLQPEELKVMVRAFDGVQNWWKAQALISPAYHTRNMVGNFWNNWLAGVKNPAYYTKARELQRGNNLDEIFELATGQKVTGADLLEMAKQNNVMGKGQFRGDIPSAIADEASSLLSKVKDPKKWNPFAQDNILFAVNKKVGGAIEDNAKLTHFMSKMLDDGMDAKSAAQSVKKFLFDYGDLTWTEKNLFKRAAPFYTWTRKNIPLQIEQMIAQPAKYALIPKVTQMIESNVPNPNTEKYMSKYLTDNIPVRYKKNDKGEYEYFMLGNWLPAAQAVDFLSQPLDNIVSMITPLAKTPFESGIPLLRDLSPYLEGTNMSLYFKDTLGGMSKIENQPGDLSEWSFGPADWMKVTMRRKDINFMRNIRVLNEIHNLTKDPAKDDPATSDWAKVLNTLLGKAGTYNVQKSKFFYDRDTERKIQEYENQIKDAQKLGDYEKVKNLRKETFDFKKLRKQQ